MVQLPPFIFGLHDTGGEGLMLNAGKPGWIVVSARAGDPGADYGALTDAGLGVIVRLNYGYGSEGTLPASADYDLFARQCAKYVASSRGASMWVIGNETNVATERPGNTGANDGEVITPELYAQCFARCRAEILGVAGHGQDLIAPAAPSPWNRQTVYAENPAGDWVKYYQDILSRLVQMDAAPTALALHSYTHGFDPALVISDDLMAPEFPKLHSHFRAYRDFLAAVPATLRTLPVFITEAQPADPDWWHNHNIGWVHAVYAEINAWNADPNNQAIQAVCLFRWSLEDNRWSISDKPRLLDDFRSTLRNNYRVRTSTWPTPPQPVETETPAPSVPTEPTPEPSESGWCPFATKRLITTNNFDIGRSGHTIKAVVMHIAAGPLTAVFPTFNDPKRLASAHFCIGRDGTIEQYLSIDDVAYAVGLRYADGQWYNTRRKLVKPTWQDIQAPNNPNLYTISVEHEGQPEDKWTDEMYAANTRLLKWIAKECKLQYVIKRTLIGHCEIDPVDRPNCPGPNVAWDRMAADANGESSSTPLPVPVSSDMLKKLQAGAAQTIKLAIDTSAALYLYAQAHALGCPQTNEVEYQYESTHYVVQWYTNGYAYAIKGDWTHIHGGTLADSGAAPSGDPVYAAALAAVQNTQWLSIHTSFALFKYAHAHGLGCPQSDEFEFTADAEYVAQMYTCGFVFVKKGDWNNVKWTKKPA